MIAIDEYMRKKTGKILKCRDEECIDIGKKCCASNISIDDANMYSHINGTTGVHMAMGILTANTENELTKIFIDQTYEV